MGLVTVFWSEAGWNPGTFQLPTGYIAPKRANFRLLRQR